MLMCHAIVTVLRGGTSKHWEIRFWGFLYYEWTNAIIIGVDSLLPEWVPYKRTCSTSFCLLLPSLCPSNLIPSTMLWHSTKVLARCHLLDLGLPSHQNWEPINFCLLLIIHLWYSVGAAQNGLMPAASGQHGGLIEMQILGLHLEDSSSKDWSEQAGKGWGKCTAGQR